ncbi:MAG: Calx-beta domain-containing protein [Planctomycetota bacterium]
MPPRREFELDCLEERLVPAAPTPTQGAESALVGTQLTGGTSFDFKVSSDWGSGFVANVVVTNNDTVPLTNWRIEFDFPYQITNIWNAKVGSRVGNHYVITPETWNGTIGAGASITLGFQGAPGNVTAGPTNVQILSGSTPTPTPPPSMVIKDATIAEGNSGTKELRFDVVLSAASTNSVTVEYFTSDGTAKAITDYLAASGTLTFSPGTTTRTISVPIVGDTAVESNEAFTLNLRNPTNATIADGQATGTITNDDTAPSSGYATATFRVTNDWQTGFGGEITITNQQSTAISNWRLEFDFPYAINDIWNARIISKTGNHYVIGAASYNGTIQPGASVTFGFNGSPGKVTSSPTNYVLNGVALGGSTPVVPTVTVSDVTIVEGNSGTKQAIFVVRLSAATTASVLVDYATTNGTATAGSDYQATNGTLTFAPGTTQLSVAVNILGDSAFESDETFTINLTNPRGATLADGQGVGTIQNDDSSPQPTTLTVNDVTVYEAATSASGFFRTSGNQIVDQAGRTVQIAGVNWFGMETSNFAPHGLWTRGYKSMMDQMKSLGYNTIRLPFSNQLFDASSVPNSINYNVNPELQGLNGLGILDKIVEYAGQIGLRIILDNHRSDAGNGPNSNGLWYTSAYNEQRWISDWVMLANRYAGNSTVIGADLKNEPHAATWGRETRLPIGVSPPSRGERYFAVNSQWLIFVEGIGNYEGNNYWWGGNLMGARQFPVRLNVADRLVYSAHDYPSTVYDQPWFSDPAYPNNLQSIFDKYWGYLYRENLAPVLIGEFGTKLETASDRAWLETLVAYLGGDFNHDGQKDIPAGNKGISWTYWSWNPNSSDTGGILNNDWTTVNPSKQAALVPIQSPFPTGGPAVAVFTVTRSGSTSQTTTVQFATADGTAKAGTDYLALAGTITFAPGETTKTVSVTILADGTVEAAENFSLVLSSPANGTISDSVGVATILDGTTNSLLASSTTAPVSTASAEKRIDDALSLELDPLL